MTEPATLQPVERTYTFNIDETRSAGDGLTLEGYAAVFNSPTTIDSWEGKFTEIIAPGAFKRSIGDKMPVMQFDHGHHPMIGGLPIGVIRSLTEDSHGLKVRARLSDNWLIEPIRDAIRDGAITGMSFRFTPKDEEWDGDTRTITAVDLHEVGPVVFPAYTATTVGVRSQSDPVSQLVELIRNDETLRHQLAEDLVLGASDDLASDGGAPTDLADGNETRTDVSVADEPQDDDWRSDALALADLIDREVRHTERKRLL